jgi:glycosyltransferase involved in cell wall biosynthesis
MARLPRILFTHTYPPGHLASFVEIDLRFLEEKYQVETLSMTSLPHPLRNPDLWRAVARNDVVFGWFGRCAPVAVVARLLHKPSLLVAGGADAVSVPEIGYGLTQVRTRRARFWLALGYRWATQVLLFSDASKASLLELRGVRTNNLATLYLGIDTEHFKPKGAKAAHALTVSYVTDENFRRKGVYTFIDAARLTPDLAFRLGGKPVEAETVNKIQALAPPNLTYLGMLSNAQLLDEYQQAKVYVQLSVHEGFGMALAEAMACGCVPVVTDRGSIPEVVGDTGVYVPVGDAGAAAMAIRGALADSDNRSAQQVRERIAALFPIEQRRVGLRAAIEATL